MNINLKKLQKEILRVRTLVFVILAIAIFALGWLAGSGTDQVSDDDIGQGDVTNQIRFYEGIEDDVSFQQFWQVWDLARELYLRGPVSEKDLFYGAISGMIEGLEDPYSVFFDPEDASSFNEELDGEYSGIGAEIGKEEGYIVVVAPLSGSPAEAAGLLSGDYIVQVGDEDIIGATVDYAVSIIRGEAGSEVILTVVRNGFDNTIEIPITRGDIEINSVEWELRDDGIMYIQLYMFNEDTTTLFRQAAQEILTSDVDGILLDMRNNPGGLLTEAINVAGFWIDDDIVVQERVGDEIEKYAANGFAWLDEYPTVILVDGGSASGSEILAGALQDYGLATLVGEQTYGKGSVQEYYEFDDGSALKITTAEWLTALGRSIDKVGITPDVVVEYTLDDYEAGLTPQFDAALSELQTAW
ncbi:S41 family peptidase [Candidatus Uhrbacteria bacterium]|jgi:carboxyl-terminal processing protease|nr:S41 family peptidase [Candidatus Uhrbacteria bacterium]MBT7717591.1 S41 family peptidase [Candidatus Uhrbacteria bacterium]